MRRFTVATFTTFTAAVAMGCSFEPKSGIGPGGTTNPLQPDGSVNLDRMTIVQDTSGIFGDACPPRTFEASNLPPQLLIVLDRSGSMNENNMGMECMGGCGAASKWAQVTSAINQVVGQTQNNVQWGLKFFGSATSGGGGGGGGGGGCNVHAMAEVPLGPMRAASIAAAIGGTMPATSTPTRAGVTQATAYLRTVTDPNPKYILLATDGQPNCREGGNASAVDDPAAIQAVAAAAAAGFPTFVIGIATNGTAEATLNMMAVNGGHPRANMAQQYYPVASAADLAMALTVIQGMVALPCQFQLGGAPSNTGAVSVTVGGQPVASTDWMFGAGNRSIVFPDTGTICMGLKAGTLKNVVITLPCGESIIP